MCNVGIEVYLEVKFIRKVAASHRKKISSRGSISIITELSSVRPSHSQRSTIVKHAAGLTERKLDMKI